MNELAKHDPVRRVLQDTSAADLAGYADSYDIAARTFQMIHEYRAPPIPKTFEVLYSYVSNDRKPVRGRVDKAIEQNGVLNLYDIDQIHSDFFSYSEAMQEKQDRTVGDIDAELANLMSVLAEHASSTNAHSRSLDTAAFGLSNGVTADQLRSTIKVLLDENQRARNQSQRLARSLELSRDTIQEMKQSLASASEEGIRDALTGLRNRRHFDRALPTEISQAEEQGAALSLCILDIDHFKKVNDTFGHPTGDAVLRVIGGLLSDNLKGRDIPVRYGGEEFAIILPKTTLSAARTIADRIRIQLSEKKLVLTGTKEPLGEITASFGVAEWEPGETASELTARADAMLYGAKRSGRNNVCTALEDAETRAASA